MAKLFQERVTYNEETHLLTITLDHTEAVKLGDYLTESSNLDLALLGKAVLSPALTLL